jgi:hypothetical protein
VHVTPDSHTSKPAFLNNLGASLQCHFEHSRDYTDINMAITIQEKADHLTFNGHSDKPACLINFEASFTCRFEHS